MIVQPLLIRKKKLALYKLIGKFSYVVTPLIFISVILLAPAQGQKGLEVVDEKIILDGPPPHLLVPFKDLKLIGTMFIIAIVKRRDVNIHARAMIATGIVFIEPSLARFLIGLTNDIMIEYLLTIFFVYTLLISIIIL